jgi:DNA helicase IV
MQNKELFPIDIEQEFCDFVVEEIDDWLCRLPKVLSSVDVAGQRRELENKGKAYRESRPQPYFGVVANINVENDEVLEVFRIGLHAIFDRRSTAIVMSWTSDEGKKFAQLERDLGGSIFGGNVDIDNGKVIQIAESNKEKAARRRRRIESARSSSLDNIIDVILPEQDDVVRIEHNGPLIIEGGPGTGKTVVALQRIAYLMSTESQSISSGNEVLIVGPTKAYVNYVENFLPKLGLGPVTNEDFDSICLRRLSIGHRQELSTLRIDPPSVRKSKNTPRMMRLMYEAVWPNELKINVMARVSIGMGKPESRYIDSSETIAIMHQLRLNFKNNIFSYNRCRRQLEIELQSRLFQERVDDGRSEGGTSLARRNRLIESWIQKIGKYSQKNRFDAQEKIDSPLGGRIKRELLTIVNKYYQEDIEIGIDLIAETGVLDVRKLEEALIEVGVPTKGGPRKGEGTTNNGAETIDLKDFSPAQVQAAKSGVVLPQVSQIVDRILPNRDVLVVAKRVCGGDAKLFEAVLGDDGKALAKRFSEASATQTNSKKYIWSDADLPIIAEISFLIDGNDGYKKFSHVVIDEAQDLTRFQSRVISRYVSGKQITLVGDPNQATRVGYLDSWDAITEAIGLWSDDLKFADANIEICKLQHNFRVPENIYDYARLYLSESDRVNTPSCDTQGGSVEIIENDPKRLIQSLTSVIEAKLLNGARIAVITEDNKVRLHVDELALENVTVLGPEESKGLEVDHTIIVQPSRWFTESERIRNLMYVVLTRSTKSVTILQHDPSRFKIILPAEETLQN